MESERHVRAIHKDTRKDNYMQFLMSGLISGLISGLGMGGGVILIAVLSYITTYSQQSLQTLNLIYYIPTAMFAIIIYLRNKQIDYKMAFKIIAYGIIPTVVASVIANTIQTGYLRKIFALYLIGIGIVFFIKSIRK